MQEWDEARLLEQLRRHGEHARRLGLRAARMGWGQHTNATLRELAALGFELDSSAIPRPRYAWETTPLRDWSTTGQDPYCPSVSDYRTAGEPALGLLEIPISTVPLARLTDTVPGVKRYISLTYEEQVFREALARCRNRGTVLITHPYELLPHASGQAAAGGMERLARNLDPDVS